MYFVGEIRKLVFNYTLSSRGFLTAKEIEMRLHRLHRCIE